MDIICKVYSILIFINIKIML